MSDREVVLHAPIRHALWSIAWPILVANELTVAIAALELFWISRLVGDTGLAVDSMYRPYGMLVAWGLASTAVGASALVSRSVGAADGEGLSIANATLSLTLTLWVGVVAIVLPLSPLLAHWLSGSLAIEPQMWRYLLGGLIALPAATLLDVVLEVANATGNTRFNIVRIGADLVCTAVLAPILILGLGIAGAPISLGIAALGLAIVLWVALVRRREELHLGQQRASVARWALWKQLLAIGVPVQIGRIFMFASQLVLMQFLARDGGATVAGYGIAGAVILFGATATFACAQAAGILIGQSIGAGLLDRARHGVRASIVMAWLVIGLFVAVTVFDRRIIQLFTRDEVITSAAHHALSIMRWGMFGVATWQVLLAAFAAHRATVRAGLLMLVGEGLGLAVACVWPGSRLDAVAAAFITSNVIKAVLLAWLFGSGRVTAPVDQRI